VTGSPRIHDLDHAIKSSATYDGDIASTASAAKSEKTCSSPALADLTAPPICSSPSSPARRRRRLGVARVSPVLAHDTKSTLAAALDLHKRAGKPTSSSRFPARRRPAGHRRGDLRRLPVNVTLLFSREQYVAAAEAYLRGVERRLAAGLNPASPRRLAVRQPLDVAVAARCPPSSSTGWASRSPSAPTRPIRAARLARFQRAAKCRRPGPAHAVASTVPRPQGIRQPLCEGARRAFTVNTMPEGTLTPMAIMARSAKR